jgi:alkanesulfonate monooxygenase SsuD/methylene tetrahydromethanopterin reductase-like flavin-dependent oxidoreductase (luciferase family)
VVSCNIRFDLRNPAFAGVGGAERYRSALDMCRWADDHGFDAVSVSEHHGTDDGYLPSPLAMAAAIAAVTRRVRIVVAAVVAPFQDPLRLAEDAAVVDLVSAGRLDIVVGAGYVPAEFEMVETLQRAWTGEPFEHRGRIVRVTPRPYQRPRPRIGLGGSSPAAARRAARIADWFRAPTPELYEVYLDELARLGRPVPEAPAPVPTEYLHLATDVEAGWEAVGRYVLHEVGSYAAMTAAGGVDGGAYRQGSLDDVRRSGFFRVVTPDEAVEVLRTRAAAGDPVTLHPMLGGMPPALAWESLRLLEREVLPEL